MARKLYKRKYLEHRAQVKEFTDLLSKASTRVDNRHIQRLKHQIQNAPLFRSTIEKNNL